MAQPMKKETIVIKVIVLGSANVGKTALMERYCTDKFSEKRNPTIGSDFRTKILEIHDTEIVLQVWDTAVSLPSFIFHTTPPDHLKVNTSMNRVLGLMICYLSLMNRRVRNASITEH